MFRAALAAEPSESTRTSSRSQVVNAEDGLEMLPWCAVGVDVCVCVVV